jgi:hypothetical protein
VRAECVQVPASRIYGAGAPQPPQGFNPPAGEFETQLYDCAPGPDGA